MSDSEGIPICRSIVNDPKDIALHYGETPGGSIYSTTPGGTRIYYDRAFLLSRRESPLTRSPPSNLPYIPEVTLVPKPIENGITKKGSSESRENSSEQHRSTSIKKEGDDQFSMEI